MNNRNETRKTIKDIALSTEKEHTSGAAQGSEVLYCLAATFIHIFTSPCICNDQQVVHGSLHIVSF